MIDSLHDDDTDLSELSDDDLLNRIEQTYRDALDEPDEMERHTTWNRFHDLRYEAAERGIRDEASTITEKVREERSGEST